MGRDKVLGLSLAILVIGFAAAFCFRNEQFVQDGLKLARSSFVDDAIAQRPGPKPYAESRTPRKKPSSPTVTLQDIEAVDPAGDMQVAQGREPNHIAEPARDTNRARKTQPNRIDPSPKTPSSEFLSPDTPPPDPEPTRSLADSAAESPPSQQLASNEPPAQSAQTRATFDQTPEIIIRSGSRHTNPADSRQPKAMTWQPVVEKREHRTGEIIDERADDAHTSVIYRVKRGDTLTRIARHYLGDGSRYLEIFSANKDKLQSPDDVLRIGMLLRIPDPSARPEPIVGPTASKKDIPFKTGVAVRQRRSRTSSVRNVSRTRKLPQTPRVDQSQPADKTDSPDSAHSSAKDRPAAKTPVKDQAAGEVRAPINPRKGGESDASPPETKIKFMPVRRSPFLPGNSDPNTPSGSAGRTLSQKPPNDLQGNAPQKDTLRGDDPDVSLFQYFPKRATSASEMGGKFDDVQLR
jgi:nucleoid-associated protein YgaU